MLRNRLILVAPLLLVGCASTISSERGDMLDQPIDCATADVDVAALKAAIPGTRERIASGIRLVIPVSRIAGRVTGELESRREIASGRTEQDLRARIAGIEAACPASRPAK